MPRVLLPLLAAALLTAGALLAQPPKAPEAPAPLFTPAYGPRLAAQDILTVPPDRRTGTRYVSLYWLPADQLKGYHALLAWLFNSFLPDVVTAPVLVGAEQRLVRVYLPDYGIDPRAFDRLVSTGSGFSSFPEGYHFLTVVDHDDSPPADASGYHDAAGRPLYWDGDALARAPDGRPYMVGQRYLYHRTEAPRKQKARLLTRLGPQIAPDDAAVLTTECHTFFPIVRADWLLYFATLENAYSDLLGAPDNLKQFEQLVYLDEKTADKLGSQRRGAVLNSEVALHNRSLQRTPTLARDGRGYVWASNDYNSSLQLQVVNGKLLNEDVLSDLLNRKPDAQEVIASNRVGLQIYYVADGQGKRLDKAAADVAIDSRTPLRDKQVWTARNCVTCHAQGIIPVEDEVRLLAQGPIQLGLAELGRKDPATARRIVDRYFARNLADLVTGDQLSYDAAVKSVNGLGAAANALLFQKALVEFEKPVGLEEVARDVGYDAATVRAVIERAGPTDHTLLGLIAKPPRPQRRDQLASNGLPALFALLAAVPRKGK